MAELPKMEKIFEAGVYVRAAHINEFLVHFNSAQLLQLDELGLHLRRRR